MRDVTRAHDREVTVIDRRNRRDLETFGSRDHRCIHYTEAQIGVGVHEVSHPVKVVWIHAVEVNALVSELTDEPHFGGVAGKLADEIRGFREHDLRNDQSLRGLLEERRAACIVRIVLDRGRYERPSVDDNYRPNSSSRWSSSNRSASATLSAPGLARAMPMKPYR